jgi:hypothetical protein
MDKGRQLEAGTKGYSSGLTIRASVGACPTVPALEMHWVVNFQSWLVQEYIMLVLRFPRIGYLLFTPACGALPLLSLE